MLLLRKCSTKSSIFAPPNVNLEFGIKWPPNYAHFCASQLRPRSPAQRGAQNREFHICRARLPRIAGAAGPLGSIGFASPYLPRALRGARRLLRPSESRAPYLPRRAPGILRFASSISSTRGCPESRAPWDPSDLRVHIFHARFGVPAVCCDPQNREPHIFRAGPLGSIRIASSISSTRVLGCLSFLATL